MFGKRNIRIDTAKTFEKIRNFLLARQSREFLIFLFFVFVSFCFWLLQVLNDEYETELSMPVRMKNVPDNVVLTSELPSSIKVGVKDRGTVLVNYLWGQTFYPLLLDFADYSDKGNHVLIPSSSFSKKITGQLNQSTKLMTIKPDTLEFIYTRGNSKNVPVKLRGSVLPARQYYVSDTIFSPDSVKVYAPKAILDTITAAFTQHVEVEGLSDTLKNQVTILPVKGARFVPDKAEMTLMADIYAEKSVDVPVIGVNFPKDKILRTFPTKVKITFQVGLSRFMEVNAEDFLVVVDYEEHIKSEGEKVRLELRQVPEGVNHVRMNLTELDYIIEQKVGLR